MNQMRMVHSLPTLIIMKHHVDVFGRGEGRDVVVSQGGVFTTLKTGHSPQPLTQEVKFQGTWSVLGMPECAPPPAAVGAPAEGAHSLDGPLTPIWHHERIHCPLRSSILLGLGSGFPP